MAVKIEVMQIEERALTAWFDIPQAVQAPAVR